MITYTQKQSICMTKKISIFSLSPSTVEALVSVNADNLIAEGKVAWLKRRKASHKATMDDKQQEYQLEHIERERLEELENGIST